MSEHDTDPEVFIRSMASRGHLGGLAGAAPQALRVLDAAGCDVILVETVGVGQSEVEIAGIADTTLVLMAPGMGDGIQAAKAGILEIGDIFVINKADREGANTTRRELRTMIGMRTGGQDWSPPIILTVATKGEGTEEVVDAILDHFAHLSDSGELTRRRVGRARREIEALALASVQRRLGESPAGAEQLAVEVAAGSLDPFAAAARLLDHS
jgi:LAO/AO transport system kinase